MSTEHLLEDIGVIINALLGDADQPRREAEERLGQLTARQPADVLLLLAQIGAQGVGGFQVAQRQWALILLIKLSFKAHDQIFMRSDAPFATAPFDYVPETVRGRIETVLCAGLDDEMDYKVRNALSVCVSSWLLECGKRKRPFLALGPVMIRLTTSSYAIFRTTPFQILDAVPRIFAEMSGVSNKPIPTNQVCELLTGGLMDNSFDVNIAAIKAMTSVLLHGMTLTERTMFGSTLLASASKTINRLPEDLCYPAMQPIVPLVETFPQLFPLQHYIPLLLQCISPPSSVVHHEADSSGRVKHLIVDYNWFSLADVATVILIALIASNRSAAKSWDQNRLLPQILVSLMDRLVTELADDDDCQNWLDVDCIDDEDYPGFVENQLEELSMVMKDHRLLVQAASDQAKEGISRPQWRSRYVSVVAMASILAGSDYFDEELDGVLNLISPAAIDPHPRIRYAFLHCIGVWSTLPKSQIQKAHFGVVLDMLIKLLSDSAARVRERAAFSLGLFFEFSQISISQHSIQLALSVLLQALEKGPIYAQETIIETITKIATKSGPDFFPFYRHIMDIQYKILALSEPKYEKLVSLSMECATSIGHAVGKQNFANDAVKVCQLLLLTQNLVQQEQNVEDPRVSALRSAWTLLATVLGSDVSPFLGFILPTLLETASRTLEEYDKTAVYSEESDLPTYTVTAEIQELETAFEQLVSFVDSLDGFAFGPWTLETMKLAIRAIERPHSDSILESACFLVPGVFQCVKKFKASGCQDSSQCTFQPTVSDIQQIFCAILDAISFQSDARAVSQLYQSLADSLRVVELALDQSNVARMKHVTVSWLENVLSLREARLIDAEEELLSLDYREWVDNEVQEEEAENTALTIVDQALGLVARFDPSALAVVEDIMQLVTSVTNISFTADSQMFISRHLKAVGIETYD